MLAASVAAAPAAALGQAFSYTGGEQTYVVPEGVTQVHVVVDGASGGFVASVGGGLGAEVSADLPILAGQTVLYVEVGGTGDGFNGGGAPNGGDASDVRLLPRAQSDSLNSRVIVAGGGGGVASFAGGDAGADGSGGSAGGKAGTSTAGGAGGVPCSGCGVSGGAGSLGQGGAGANGGGGGGGYYGGGGGAVYQCGGNYCDEFGAGGGGSSYAAPQTLHAAFGLEPSRMSGVTITPSATTAPAVMLSGLRVSPRRFALGGRRVGGRCVAPSHRERKHRRCKRPVALRISYTLNVAATVTFTLDQTIRGRLVGGRCRAHTKANRRRICRRLIRLSGSFAQAGAAGTNNLLFKGRIGGRPLTPGSYRLIATPSESNQQTTSFTLGP